MNETDFPYTSNDVQLLRLLHLIMAGIYGLMAVMFFSHCYVIISIIIVIKKAERVNDVQHFVYVLTLVVVDAFVLSHLPLLVVDIVKSSWVFGTVLCQYFWIAESVNKLLSTFLLTALCFDRYVVVCFQQTPFARMRNYKLALAIILICIICAFGLLAPIYANAVVIEIGDGNSTILRCIMNWPEDMELKFTFVIFAVGYCIPLALMTFFYCSVIKQLRTQARVFQSIRIQRRTQRVTKRSFTLVLFYFLCWTPFWSITFYTISRGSLTSVDVILFYFVHWMVYLNSAMNPVFYVFFNSEFRNRRKRNDKNNRTRNYTADYKSCTSVGGGGSVV